jgi:aspartate/methionine/tyrosine aminotransferase
MQNLYISTATTAQYAGLAAIDPVNKPLLEARREAFALRRQVLLDGLRELGFGIEYEPRGAYYIYADISHLLNEQGWSDSEAFCFDVLEKYGVALTPGTDFDEYAGHKRVRFAYTLPEDRLREALARLKIAIGA